MSNRAFRSIEDLPKEDPGQGDRLMARKRGGQRAMNTQDWFMEMNQNQDYDDAPQEEYDDRLPPLYPSQSATASQDSNGVQNIMVLEDDPSAEYYTNGNATSGIAGYHDASPSMRYGDDVSTDSSFYREDAYENGFTPGAGRRNKRLRQGASREERRPGAPSYDKDRVLDSTVGSFFDKRETWKKTMEAASTRGGNFGTQNNRLYSTMPTGGTRDDFKTLANSLPIAKRKLLTQQRKRDTEAALRLQQELDDREAYERYREEQVQLRRIQIRETLQNRILKRLELEQKSLTAPTYTRGRLSQQRTDYDSIHEKRFDDEAHRLWWQQARREHQRKKLHERQHERQLLENYCQTYYPQSKTIKATQRMKRKQREKRKIPEDVLDAMEELNVFDEKLKQEQRINE